MIAHWSLEFARDAAITAMPEIVVFGEPHLNTKDFYAGFEPVARWWIVRELTEEILGAENFDDLLIALKRRAVG